MIKVSLIMPAYNKEIYVEKTVCSLLNQSLTEIELIIIEDCSTDATYDIIKRFADKDSRIRLYRNDQNMGGGIFQKQGIGYGIR